MRPATPVITLTLALSLTAGAQSDAPKTKVSKEPLSVEHIAVYRAVLEYYMNQDYAKESHRTLNLANKTEPFDPSDPFFHAECVKGTTLETVIKPVLVIHELDSTVVPSPEVVLVDPDRQKRRVEDGDPHKLVERAVEGEKVTDKEIEESVRKAFDNGLFTLTEIIFDKHHRHALLAYSFVCGSLCGHGDTLLLKRIGKDWKVSKTCGGWVS